MIGPLVQPFPHISNYSVRVAAFVRNASGEKADISGASLRSENGLIKGKQRGAVDRNVLPRQGVDDIQAGTTVLGAHRAIDHEFAQLACPRLDVTYAVF